MLASLTEPRKRGLIDFLGKEKSPAKGMWKAIVENASRLPQRLTHILVPFGHRSLIDGVSFLVRLWHIAARWARGIGCR